MSDNWREKAMEYLKAVHLPLTEGEVRVLLYEAVSALEWAEECELCDTSCKEQTVACMKCYSKLVHSDAEFCKQAEELADLRDRVRQQPCATYHAARAAGNCGQDVQDCGKCPPCVEKARKA